MATITFRTDDAVDKALAGLLEGAGDRSQVIRDAILGAWRDRQDARLRAEAEVLAADPAERDEARAVLADMDALRAW